MTLALPALDPDIFYTLIDGDPRLPCLVFLHEGLGCTAMWGDFPRRLCAATGCRGLCYDRRVHGQSGPLRQRRTVHYLHQAALFELPAVIDTLIPDTPYILVGHSDGGSIALIHAAQRPPLLKAVITAAAHVCVEAMTLTGIRASVAAYDAGKLGGLIKYHGAQTPALFAAWADTWLSPWFAHWNIEYLLPSIECPLLVMQGRDDQYGSEEQVRTIVAKASGPAHASLVDDCGHSPHRERPTEVLALMREFIAGQCRPAAATPPPPPV